MSFLNELELALLMSSIQILLYSPYSLSLVTIGLDKPEETVSEQEGPVHLCAAVTNDGNTNNYNISVSIIYQNKNAYANLDFEDTAYTFQFTPNSARHCFNVRLINDQRYEVREEFFVNITSDNSDVNLNPHFTIIRVDDDDVVTIGWENTSYTVGEADQSLEVCAVFHGTLDATLSQSQIAVVQGTAKLSEDFRFTGQNINFPRGSVPGSTQCYTVTILNKDIEYEGEKNFSLVIVRNNAERLNIDPQTTTITITDYNVITVQQPASACIGLSNLINTSSAADICEIQTSSSSEICNAVTCSTSDWNLVLSFDACEEEVMLNVTDNRDDVTTSGVFSSNKFPQYLNHTLGNETGETNLTSRVVSNEQNLYYLLTLNSSLLNLSFPTTAIPVECIQTESDEISTTSLVESSSGRARESDEIPTTSSVESSSGRVRDNTKEADYTSHSNLQPTALVPIFSLHQVGALLGGTVGVLILIIIIIIIAFVAAIYIVSKHRFEDKAKARKQDADYECVGSKVSYNLKEIKDTPHCSRNPSFEMTSKTSGSMIKEVPADANV